MRCGDELPIYVLLDYREAVEREGVIQDYSKGGYKVLAGVLGPV